MKNAKEGKWRRVELKLEVGNKHEI